MKIKSGEFIGTLSKSFGNDGRVLLKHVQGFSDRLKKMELVIIEINNQPVPFFLSHIEVRNSKSAIIKFHDYDNREIIEEFIGCKVYSNESISDISDNSIYSFSIKGFKVIDEINGEIGTISEILEFPKNSLLKIVEGEREFLIPFVKESIVKVNKSKKILNVKIPDGLLNIND